MITDSAPALRINKNTALFKVSLLLFLIFLLLPAESNAQEVRHTSLFGWEEQTRNMIKDRYHNYGGGFVHLEFTFLDWGNNAVYELSRRRGDSLAEFRKFDVKPYLLSIKAASPVILNLRWEIMAGVQTLQESAVQGSYSADDCSYRLPNEKPGYFNNECGSAATCCFSAS